MSHDHAHHSHDVPRGGRMRPLAITLGLVLAYMGLEVVGGLLSGSLALLADAGHMLSDAGALGITLFAMRLARRTPTARRTYGYHRAEILAALVNGATLIAIAILITIEAYRRLSEPATIAAGLMLWVALGGLLVNGLGLWILRGSRGGGLNEHGAWLHVLTDALGSVQVIIAAGLIWGFGWSWVDPVASVLIAVLVVYSAWSLVAQSLAVLMENAPGNVDVDALRQALLSLPGVTGVTDLHVWSITSGLTAMSAHIGVTETAAHDDVLVAARQLLAEGFAVHHSTIELDRSPDTPSELLAHRPS